METLIIQAECRGKLVKLIKIKNQFKVLDNGTNEYENVTFMSDKQALITFREKAETIIQ